jgi:glycosyltransferase involved in cell wall biosynthesis
MIEIGSDFLSADYDYDRETFCSHFGISLKSSFKNYLSTNYPNKLSRRFYRRAIKLQNYLNRGRTFERLNIHERRISANRSSALLTTGDSLILLGSTWDFPPYINKLLRVKADTGIRITLFVHDLIPIVTPQYVGQHATVLFHRWLSSLAGIADHFLVNSNSTKLDLLRFLEKQKLSPRKIDVIPLAHEFVQSRKHQHQITDGSSSKPSESGSEYLEIRAVLNLGRPYVLCVGTQESRKNLWTLVNVWKALLEEIGPELPTLVLAGKPGTMREDLEGFLRATGNLHGYIRICERPTDHELAYLYRHCLFSVFPSLYEGWGLPIGESLWFGRFVVASNTSSMPEVGGDMIDYVDPASFRSVFDGIKRPIVDRTYLEARTAQVERHRLRTWGMVADDLWNVITREPDVAIREEPAAPD